LDAIFSGYLINLLIGLCNWEKVALEGRKFSVAVINMSRLTAGKSGEPAKLSQQNA
jgi:hypothetical protein